jgi:hypothetical protein
MDARADGSQRGILPSPGFTYVNMDINYDAGAASLIPYYSVHAVGGQLDYVLPVKNLEFFFKYGTNINRPRARWAIPLSLAVDGPFPSRNQNRRRINIRALSKRKKLACSRLVQTRRKKFPAVKYLPNGCRQIAGEPSLGDVPGRTGSEGGVYILGFFMNRQE